MPIPDHLVRDPRIRRTRLALQDGLRTLLRQRPLDEILVHDITSAAAVNRATFYDHYADKLELFNALIAADFQQLLEKRNVRFDGTCDSGLLAIALAAADYLQQLHRDHAACTRQSLTGPLTDGAITMAIRQVLLCGLSGKTPSADAPAEELASMAAAALYCGVKERLARSQWEVKEEDFQSLLRRVKPLLHPEAV